MRPLVRSACALAVGLSLLAGCQPVREDRHINFSTDGKDVGFQHDKEGVFVADGKGDGLKKIFEPTEDTLAVSSPLFAPTDKRLIFTSAKAVKGDTSGRTIANPLDPAGALHYQRPAVYTCWLRAADDDAKPEPLFTADCDHVGYVAANLAVRWHPKGDRVLFLDRTADGRHCVFEFDLTTKAKKQVFPHTAAALVFDWAPDREHLVCVLGEAGARSVTDGIWVGKPGEAAWWQVPESSALAEGELPSLIEQLRATRPAWTPDGRRFAFVSYRPSATQGQPGTHLLRTADLAARTVQTVAESPEPFRDLAWAPDGKRLGVVKGKELGTLHVVQDGVLGPAINRRPVRLFAGWRSDGSRLCYVVPDTFPLQDENWNAFLFVPDPLARDAVFLAPGKADDAGREAFTGMRVTFPQWSPTEEKLSLWATFAPTYRSWLSAVLGSALRPGDPAAVIDLPTGKLGWMAVNAHEKAQVGHYHLLLHEYAEAWRWYEQARADEAAKAKPGAEDFSFFEWYCLTKLGRDADAAAKLEQFRKEFRPSFGRVNGALPLQGVTVGGRTAEQWFADLSDPKTLSGQLLRDLYEAKVFLSLDAATDGEAFFRGELAAAKTDEEKLSHAVVLGQFLLLEKKPNDYGELTTKTILPLLSKMWDPEAPEKFADLNNLDMQRVQQFVLMGAGAASLLPLADPDFLKSVPDDALKACVPELAALAAKAKDDLSRHGANLVLFAVARKLGLEKERQEAAEALKKSDATFDEKTFNEKMGEALSGLRLILSGLMKQS